MKDSKTKKAYIYISGHEENKSYIDGSICYEVSEQIPGQFQWDEAQEIIKRLYPYKEWRLPTIEELELIYKSRIINFDIGTYWSSSDFNNDDAWLFDFDKGDRYINYRKYYECVRAIRAFKN